MERMKKLGLMTVAEAAEYLNVPRPTLYQHLREGHIPGIQIGGRWRIEQEKLNAFIGKAKRGSSSGESFQPIMDENGFSANDSRFSRPVQTQPSYAEPVTPSIAINPETADRLEALRSENSRLRALVADQLLDLERLRGQRLA